MDLGNLHLGSILPCPRTALLPSPVASLLLLVSVSIFSLSYRAALLLLY